MKTLLIGIFISIIGLTGTISAQNNTNTSTPKLIRKTFPHYSIGLTGGAIFPLPKLLNQTFKPGGSFAVDFGIRINKEVGIYARAGYDFMASKITTAPVGSYIEFGAGPRYYFLNPKLKSQLFVEGSVGGYYFKQNAYTNPGDTSGAAVTQISNVKAGLSGGIGSTLYLSDAADILVKTRYNVVFTPNGTTSFITVGAGLEFRFK